MVKISLYRGNLHRVPDKPRQWPMPRRVLTLEQFRILSRRREQALARLAAKRNPSLSDLKEDREAEVKEEEGEAKDRLVEGEGSGSDPQPIGVEEGSKEKAADDVAVQGSETETDSKMKAKAIENEEASVDVAVKESETETSEAKTEVSNNLDSDNGTRKVELEKKLEVLNQKKHNLVQMLKQILNAEEEIKRRNAQSAALHASNPLQAETTVDMGSATRLVPRLSVEVNFSGDLGSESDATACHSNPGRQTHHMHSTSPSAAPLTRPFQQNTFLPNPRSSLATSASPSRFAPPGHQGLHHHSASLPQVSVPGPHFMASSPSPVASGGALSGFRESRHTSSS